MIYDSDASVTVGISAKLWRRCFVTQSSMNNRCVKVYFELKDMT